jgi:DNA-binding NarL/FixJ family response regulator
MSGLRVVVAEDAVLFREGLVRVLEDAGHAVVAVVGDADALLLAVAEHRPELAIVDVRMPPRNESDGAQAAGNLRSAFPDTGILLLSQHIELRHCRDLLGTPGFGYLLKESVLRLEDFDDAIRRVAAGGVALAPEVVQALVRSQTVPDALAGLTEREREILALVAEGTSNRHVAELLAVSDRTVEAHMRSIFTKLGLHDDGSKHRRVLAVLTHLEAHARR